jgi:hypothetical protein
MRHDWHAPETTEEPCDKDILFRLWQMAQHRSRFATLKQHRIEIVIGFEQAYVKGLVCCWRLDPSSIGVNITNMLCYVKPFAPVGVSLVRQVRAVTFLMQRLAAVDTL